MMNEVNHGAADGPGPVAATVINGAASVKESSCSCEGGAAIDQLTIETSPWQPGPGMSGMQLESILARKRSCLVAG
jgi:hypothetical protein